MLWCDKALKNERELIIWQMIDSDIFFSKILLIKNFMNIFEFIHYCENKKNKNLSVLNLLAFLFLKLFKAVL